LEIGIGTFRKRFQINELKREPSISASKTSRGNRTAPPPVVDGNIVTVVRSKYYREEAGEAIRTAVENARSKK
jgi:hypothetical protein